MKNIRIQYLKLEEKLENCLMEVALDYPKYEQTKNCYLYELFYFDTLQQKIIVREEEIVKYGIINGELAPFFIKIEDEIFEQLKEYFSRTTEYEECKWNDDLSLLHAVLSIYRQDPKSWEV